MAKNKQLKKKIKETDRVVLAHPNEHLLGRLGLAGCFGRISRPSLALKKIGTVLIALARYTPLKEG